MTDKTDKMNKTDKTDKMNTTDKMNKTDKTDKTNKTDKTDKANKTDKTDKANKTDKTDKANKTDKTNKTDKANKTDKTNKTDKAENALNSEIVKELGLKAGAWVAGIAASKDFDLAPEGYKPTDTLPECLSVIVFGIPVPKDALETTEEYTNSRKKMIEKINDISKDVEKQIRANGYRAQAINGFGGKWVNGRQYGLISLKHAAELAGLGVIGRNKLLINPKYGTLLWLGAVLTNADLIPDNRIQDSICNNCNKCVELCPSNALENPEMFKTKECSRWAFKQVSGKMVVNCFLCRNRCSLRIGLDRKV
ncbi:MAG: 4Fe-4S binding protein [Methanimicrococcus sp.]|nr:4Fe-4S binding protein [Methanimicrococcus sp.]